jgi:hypothetical protein
MNLDGGETITAYPTHAGVIDRFCRTFNPDKGPRAMPGVPRLGIGARMTTAVWPGIFDAMARRSFATITIQNSVRELNLLDDLLAARPPDRNYACGFGTIETGYTGSTFEGLWVSGVLAALQFDGPVRYGADADHIQVKRGPEGLARAKRVIEAARYYTFYTLDMSDILDYAALTRGTTAAGSYITEKIQNAGERRDVVAYHSQRCRIGKKTFRLDSETAERLVGKYWVALQALADLAEFIGKHKEGQPFDLEFTIDEHPPEIHAFDCISTQEEVWFVLREINRRGIPVTHIAPNFGVEKGWNYRCPDGLQGLEKRIRALFPIAEEFGVLLDFHSADDLTSGARRAIRRATGGRHHYKISPVLQLIFAEVLQEYHPGLFQRWWDHAMAYARHEAAAGSPFAAECIAAYENRADKAPSRHDMVFHHYSFAFVGRRDARGQFPNREEFYDLSPEFYREYQQRIAAYLCELADDLF